MQTDPIGYEDNVNLYGYVGQDPINGTDFTGLEEDDQADEGTLREMVERLSGTKDLTLDESWKVLGDHISSILVNEEGTFEIAGGRGSAAVSATGSGNGTAVFTYQNGDQVVSLTYAQDGKGNWALTGETVNDIAIMGGEMANGRGEVDVGPGRLVREMSNRARSLTENIGDRVDEINSLMRAYLGIEE